MFGCQGALPPAIPMGGIGPGFGGPPRIGYEPMGPIPGPLGGGFIRGFMPLSGGPLENKLGKKKIH